MLRSSDDLARMVIHATDGELGRVVEFYFDDRSWTVRHFVVETGRWLSGRTVLLPPAVVSGADWTAARLSVSLTQDQVRESPDLGTDLPVSRRRELEYFRYYDQPPYWILGAEVAGPAAAIDAALRRDASEAEAAGAEPPTHLRSSREVCGYRLEAADGAIGRLRGYLLEDAAWRIRYLVVDAGHWWTGKDVVIAPDWVTRVSWGDRCLRVGRTREAIRSSPAFDPHLPLTPEAEARLADHFRDGD